MDHLPPVQGPALPLLEVPYLCAGLPYDQGDFSEYPQRQRVDMQQLDESLRGNVEVSDETWLGISQFLQSWLYMGLLHQFYQYIVRPFDEKFFVEKFVRTDRFGQRVITTAKLPHLLEVWVKWNRAGPPVLRAKLSRSLQRVLSTVKSYIMLVPTGDLLKEIPPPPRMPQQVQDVLLSITILQMSLLHALSQAEGHSDGLIVDMPHILGSPFVTQRLLKAKWCPRWISQLSMHLGPLDLLYAGQLQRYGTQQDHESCSVGECVHSYVDETNYHTRHTPSCEGCKMLSVDEDEIAACLAQGEYPLVVLEASTDAVGTVNPRLKVVCREEGRPYVAFSHVWSDGLGNPLSNSLPTCQIIRLAKTLYDLSSPELSAVDPSQMSTEERLRLGCWSMLKNNGEQSILFWIDTLCIPAQKQLKKTALSKLHDTFSNANQVVVLDTELQNTSWQTPILENLMRIRLTKWMTRLWTLEEAILTRAGSLCFLFKDGLFTLDETVEEAKRHIDSGHFLHRAIQLATFRPFGRILRIKNIPAVGKITELGHLMVTRSTTKPGDEALIVATALGLDNGTLFSTPVDLRTQALLKLQRYWPYHILFNNMLSRMTNPGYRWAPQSFLGKGISPFMLGSGDLSFNLTITGEQVDSAVVQAVGGPLQIDGGLVIALPGFQFQDGELPLGSEISSGKTYFSFFDVASRAWYSVVYTKYNGDQPWDSLRMPPQSRRSHFGIVLPMDIPASRFCEAVLVSVYGAATDRKMLYAEFRCVLRVFRAASSLPSSTPTPTVEPMPPIDHVLPASRELCEGILDGTVGKHRTLEHNLRKEKWASQDKLKRAAENFRRMLCAGQKVEDGQKWCIG